MSVSYFKRYRMELDLRGRRPIAPYSPPGYRLLPWEPNLLYDHADVKYLSFRDEIDADVFDCLGELDGCQRLMQEISQKDGFLPSATWLATAPRGLDEEPCGTIQGIRTAHKYGAIQNVGIVPGHRDGDKSGEKPSLSGPAQNAPDPTRSLAAARTRRRPTSPATGGTT